MGVTGTLSYLHVLVSDLTYLHAMTFDCGIHEYAEDDSLRIPRALESRKGAVSVWTRILKILT